MNKNKLFLLGACLFLITGCSFLNKGKGDSNSSSNQSSSLVSSESSSEPSSEPSSESSSESSSSDSDVTSSDSSSEGTKLDAPVLRLSDDKEGVVWDDVEGATQYTVNWDDTYYAQVFPGDDLRADFYKTIKTHTITVIACANEAQFNSDPSLTYSYETKAASLASLENNDGVITWGAWQGLNLEVKELNDENYSLISGDNYVVSKTGFYLFRAAVGYDDNSNIYYVESATTLRERGILVAEPATEAYVLEDGSEDDNAELQEQYDVQKYGNNGWETSTAVLSLDVENEKVSPNKCIKVQYWHHGVWFKFDKALNTDKSFDTLSFYAKGDDAASFMVSFEIKDHVVIGDIDLIGVYITYNIDPIPGVWKYYSISLDDPAWLVTYGGQKFAFKDISGYLKTLGVQIDSLGDMMPFFGGFQVRVKAPVDENWSKAYAWFDEMTLSNTGAASYVTTPLVIFDDYAFSSDAFNGTAHFDNGTAGISTSYLGSPVEVEGTYEGTDDGGLRLTITKPGFETVATLSTDDGGNTFYLVSIEGEGAAYFNNLALARYAPADNFESYEATGVGFDNTHGIEARSGLRAHYYCDFYNEGIQSQQQSPMGGNNWYLMGSSDYLNLVDTGRNGSKAAKLRYSGYSPMRYMTYGLSDGTATPIGSGEKFSFWIKGSENRQITIKVRVYSSGNKLTPATQQDNSILATIVVPQNSDWTEYTIDLNKNLTYYGYSFILQTNWDEVSDYIYLDDIAIYSSISPWGN